MEHLEYTIVISASAKTVWETMLQKETYKQWVAKAWPDSSYEGKWGQGERIRFIGPEGSGTLAELVEVKPYERILAHHIAVLLPGGVEDRSSEMAKGWVGITEEYRFSEHHGNTTVTVLIATTPAWRKMFDEGWPMALQELK
ncbi:MAG TPA: SRPBCC domain-containing protein, partial [Chryseosolibacter sp.]|nr:SRPBCC domain-containing protein [Chryseosolibacter sp.]